MDRLKNYLKNYLKCSFFDERFLIFSEFFFTFSLQTTRLLSKTDLGYELTIKFGNPVNMEVQTRLLMLMAFFALFFGWLADGIAGKCYVMILGLVFAVFSFFTAIMEHLIGDKRHDNEMLLSTIFLLLYTATSGVRNALILEQILVGKKITVLRRYIFCYILVRLIAYSIYPISEMMNYGLTIYIIYAGYIGVIIGVIYLIFILCIIHKLYIEPTYFLIWERCVMCIFLSVKNRILIYLKERKEVKKVEDIRPAIHYPEPADQSILSKRKPRVKFRSKVEVRLQSMAEERFNMFFAEEPGTEFEAWGYRLIKTGTKPSLTKGNPQTPVVRMEALNDKDFESQSTLFSFSNLFVKKDPSIGPDSSSVNLQLNLKRPKRNVIRTFFDHSKPRCTDYTVNQTWKLIPCFYIIMPPFFFTFLIFTVCAVTEYQVDFVVRSDLERPNILEYNFYFDVLLMPFFEFIFYPILVCANTKEWHFIIIGYLFLFMAVFSTMLIQMKLQDQLQYLPNKDYSQVRVYNTLPTSYFVKGSWEKTFTKISPLKFALFKNVPVSTKEEIFEMRITQHTNEEGFHYNFKLPPGHAVSYMIVKNNLLLNTAKDPTILSKTASTERSKIYLITNLVNHFSINFNSVKKDKFVSLHSNERGVPKSIERGDYWVHLLTSGNETILEKVRVRKSCMYSYFVYSKDNHTLGSLQKVEGPLKMNFYLLFFPMAFISIANICVSISYYTIVFLLSPEKLRAFIFSAIVAVNLISAGIINSYLNDPTVVPVFKFLIGETIACAFLLFLQLFISEKFELPYRIGY